MLNRLYAIFRDLHLGEHAELAFTAEEVKGGSLELMLWSLSQSFSKINGKRFSYETKECRVRIKYCAVIARAAETAA